MKQNKKFFRSLFFSLIIIFNIFIFALGVCTVYENMQLINFGKYVNAIEISDSGIKILDFFLQY